MGREKVDIQVDANVANAIAQMMELVKAQDKLGTSAQDIGAKGKSASKDWASGLDGVIGKWATLGSAIGIAQKALKAYFDESKRLRDEQVGATRSIDTGITGYRLSQGNLSPSAGLEAGSRISTVAQEHRTSNESGFAAATMLAKYGVGREQAEGAALGALLDVQDVAQAQGKVDPEHLSRSVLDYLQRTNQSINGETIRRTGAAAFHLTQNVKGFDAGEMGIAADVAKYGQAAGLAPEETMGVVAALSEDYGEGSAKRKFKKLFNDTKYSSEEKKQVAALRARSAGYMSAGDAGYEEAVKIAGGSMTDEEARAEAGYQASAFKPGAMDSETVRKRLLTAMRQEGAGGPMGESLVNFEYGILDWLGGPEFAVNSITNSQTPENRAQANRIREQALGRQEMTVRILAPDGRDIPTQTDAEGLNDLREYGGL